MSSQFELHCIDSPAAAAEDDLFASATPPVHEAPPPLCISLADGVVPVGLESSPAGLLARLAAPTAEALRLRVVRQGVGSRLALVSREPWLLNGVDAPPLALLHSGDQFALRGANAGFAVAERITPHFGLPTPEMIGGKCSVCKLPIEHDQFVLSCRCTAVVHFQTAETAPQTPPEDRLSCGADLKACIACGHRLSRESYLVWDPREL